jgi:S-adenosylmethionine synthetase
MHKTTNILINSKGKCGLLLCVLTLLVSCATLKKSKSNSETLVAIDSALVNNQVKHDASTSHQDITKDSLFTIPFNEADISLGDDDLKPATTSAGKPVEHDYHFDDGRAHGTVTVKPDGKVNIKCECDSIKQLVHGLRIIIDSVTRSNDSISRRKDKVQVIHETATAKTIVKEKFSLKWFLIAIAIGIFIIPVGRWVIDLVKHWAK